MELSHFVTNIYNLYCIYLQQNNPHVLFMGKGGRMFLAGGLAVSLTCELGTLTYSNIDGSDVCKCVIIYNY